MDKFTEYLKSKINGLDKFDLLEAIYNKNADTLSVVFVYMNLDQNKKNEVESLVKRVIKNISNINVIFKDLYFDDEIIFKEVRNFLSVRKGDLLGIDLDLSSCKNGLICLVVDQNYFSEQELNMLSNEINKNLKSKYFKEFEIKYNKTNFNREEVLSERINNELGVEDFGAEYQIDVHHIVPIIGEMADENFILEK